MQPSCLGPRLCALAMPEHRLRASSLPQHTRVTSQTLPSPHPTLMGWALAPRPQCVPCPQQMHDPGSAECPENPVSSACHSPQSLPRAGTPVRSALPRRPDSGQDGKTAADLLWCKAPEGLGGS